MERLTNIGSNGEIWITDNDYTRRNGRKESAYKKLAEYEDLEEQGLLLRLPCKLGTSVYMVEQDCGGDILDCMRGDCEGCPYLYSFIEENKFDAYMLENIGKTVFLTQEEAEQKLKEMESVHFRKE